MSSQEREAIQWLAVLGVVLSVLVLISPGIGVLLTFCLALWLHYRCCNADMAKPIDKSDGKWW